MDRPLLGSVRETPFVNPIISTNGLISLTCNCQLPGGWQSRAVAGGGLYFRKDTRVDFQWIVRKKVRVFSFKFEIELI